MAEAYPAARNFTEAQRSSGLGEVKREATEMEALANNLADTARRLSGLADKLQERVDGFMETNEKAGPTTVDQSPQPGTLGCIKFYHGKINMQCDRIDSHLMTLAGIL